MVHEYQALTLIEDENSIAVKSCKDVESVVIPSEFNSKPVTAINQWAFAGSNKLKSVVIPNTVTKIYGNAFGGCMNLEQIIIPNSVTEMGHVVFGGCEKLEIFAEILSLPEKWHALWNTWNRPVYWYSEEKKDGNYWHYVDGKPVKW